MSDSYYLGIDGGGSKTAFALIDQNNELIYHVTKGPTALDTVSFDEFKNVIKEGTKDIKVKVDSIFLGIGGIYSKEQIDNVISFVKTLDICKEDTAVDAANDVVNALYGALDGKDGIMLIAGTGSVCFGKNKNKYCRVGGYCYKEGDLGSGYDLGNRTLKYLAKVIDKREEESSFASSLKRELNIYNYEDLTSFFIKASRTDIAAISRLVTKYQDEEEARKIIEDGVNEVLKMISTCYRELDFKGKTFISVIGSLGNADTLYRSLLLKGIEEISKDLVFITKINEAYIGSALKAKEMKRC